MAFYVRVSPDLIEQLQEESGIIKKPEASTSHLPSFSLPGYGGIDPATAALIARNRELQHTLARSQKVGALLLKHETEELKRVESMTNELLGSKHARPSHQHPCSSERQECIKCYHDHAGDQMQCRSSVLAYQECSQRLLFNRGP